MEVKAGIKKQNSKKGFKRMSILQWDTKIVDCENNLTNAKLLVGAYMILSFGFHCLSIFKAGMPN